MRNGVERYDGMGLGTAALKGAAAAVVGGLAMKLVWELGERTLAPAERFGSPTRDAVDDLARRADVRLDERQRDAASLALFTGAMATWGAVYGMMQSRLHPPSLLHGLVLGGLVYAANFSSAAPLPRAGIVPAFGDQHGRQRAVPLGAHAAFGVATALAFDAMA